MNRRRFVRNSSALAAGALLPLPAAAELGVIHELSGEVLLNGRPMARNSAITAGQRIATGANGRLWFTIAGDAYFVRPGSELSLAPALGAETLFDALRLLSGAIGAVFRPGVRRTVRAPTVTIGVRGTGIYLAARAEETYVCNCFGAIELVAPGGDSTLEEVKAAHHAGRRIGGGRVQPAAMEGHTDEEMSRLERLVGRPNPFNR